MINLNKNIKTTECLANAITNNINDLNQRYDVGLGEVVSAMALVLGAGINALADESGEDVNELLEDVVNDLSGKLPAYTRLGRLPSGTLDQIMSALRGSDLD